MKYFMHGRKTFIKRHSGIQRRSRPKLFRTCGLLWPNAQALLMLAPQIGFVFQTPCTWNYYPSRFSSRRDDLRLSCLLARAPRPLESSNECRHIVIWLGLHYIRALLLK